MTRNLFFLTIIMISVFSWQLSAVENAAIGGYLDTGISFPSGWNGSWSYPEVSSEMQLNVRYRGDFSELNGAVNFTMDDLVQGNFADKLSIEPDEMSLSLYYDQVDLTLGYQRFSWGTADGVNPTDNINPRDMSDLNNLASQDIKEMVIPVLGAGITYYPNEFMSIEGVILPLFTPPGLPDITEFLSEELSGLTVHFTYPDNELVSFESGLRTSFYLPGVDFSLSYLYAWDDTPDIRITAVNQTELIPGSGIYFGSPAAAEFTFNRVHIIGGDFALPIGDIDFRGEAAYFLTEDLKGEDIYIKNPYLHYAVGAGYTFDSLTANLQFSQQIISNYKKISDYSCSIDPTDPAALNQSDSYYEEAYTLNFFPLASSQRGAVMSSLMLILNGSYFNGYLESSLIGMYNFPDEYDDNAEETKYGDLMLAPSVTYQIADAFEVNLGAALFFSLMKDSHGDFVTDESTMFGMADDLDQFYLKFRYSY